jgi:hypothetical protein
MALFRVFSPSMLCRERTAHLMRRNIYAMADWITGELPQQQRFMHCALPVASR